MLLLGLEDLQPRRLPHYDRLLLNEKLRLFPAFAQLVELWHVNHGCSDVELRPQNDSQLLLLVIGDLLALECLREGAIHMPKCVEVVLVNLEFLLRRGFEHEGEGLLSQGPYMRRSLDQLLPNVTTFGSRDTVELVKVKMHGEVTRAF